MAVSHRALLRAAEDGRLKHSFRQLLWHRGLPRVSSREYQYQSPLPPQPFASPPDFNIGEAGNFRRGSNVAPFLGTDNGSAGHGVNGDGWLPAAQSEQRSAYGNNQGHFNGYS